MKIPLGSIYIGDRARKDYGKTELDDFKRDMEENGQITAITVRPPNDDDRARDDYEGQPWVLVAGGRRVFAASLLGWEEIEAFGREEMGPIKHRTLELSENLHRKAMTWQEEVDAKAEIATLLRLQRPELTDQAIAKEIGIHSSSLSRDLATAKILEKNPGLRSANSKHAALQAGKLLEQHEVRVARVTAAQSGQKVEASHVAPLEERIRTAEALEFARALPANSMDYACNDGPYGYNYWKQGQKTDTAQGSHLSSYDDDPERTGDLYRELLPEIVRVVRETGWISFFCGKETYDFLEELAKDCCATHASYRDDKYPKQCKLSVAGSALGGTCRFLVPEPFPWFWYRPNSRNQPRYKDRHAKNMAELLLVINMGKGRIVKHPCPNVLVHDAEYGSDRVHVNQKPIPLYRDLIERFTFPGDSVVDFFFGSGNSMAATASLARIPWGCDKNPGMLPFATGKVQQYAQPITRELINASMERYQRNLANEIPEETSFEEVDESTAPREPARPKAGQSFMAHEAMKAKGADTVYFIAYVYYDGWNMRTCTAATEEEAYDRAESAAALLNILMQTGKIDPTTMDRDTINAIFEETSRGGTDG